MATQTKTRRRHRRRHPAYRIASAVAEHWILVIASHSVATVVLLVLSHRLGVPLCG